MDFDKLKKDLAEKGIEKGKEEVDRLKGRLGNFNSGRVNTTTRPQEGTEVEAGAPTEDNSGQTGATPVMDSGKAGIREPGTIRHDQEIREPEPDEHEAAAQQQESHREAAIEQNPARDEGDEGEESENAA
jgi:hypothetical protein